MALMEDNPSVIVVKVLDNNGPVKMKATDHNARFVENLAMWLISVIIGLTPLFLD